MIKSGLRLFRYVSARLNHWRLREVETLLSPPTRSLTWLRGYELPTGGIRVHSAHPNAYPEVTGYIIPTLLLYGQRELATRFARGLLCIQKADGSHTSSDGVPQIFDTGQVLRDLSATTHFVPEG